MGRVGNAIAALAVATALSTMVVAVPAQAQGTQSDSIAARAAGQGQERLLLEARELIYNNDNNTVTAVGDVEMYYGGRTLQADRVIYDQNTGRVFAEGNARLIDVDGTVATGDRFELTEDFRSGFIDSLRVEQTIVDQGRPTRARFSAPRAERIDGEQTIFQRGSYTACDTCEKDPTKPPLWQVRAARVIHDNESRTIYYENASLEFLGVPVAYIPYFWSPDPTVKRKTGFLTPTFVFSEPLGFGVTIPFFWATGDSHDLTFRPTILHRQGVLADVEWRQRLLTGSYSIRATGIFQQDRRAFHKPPSGAGDRNFRGSIETQGRFAINPRWNWGWDVTAVTDKWYLENYRIRSSNITTSYVRDAISTVYLTGRGDRSWFDMRGYYFKGLTSTDFQKQQPLVHPVLDYNKRVDGPPGLGGEISIDANLTSLSREVSQFQPIDPRNPLTTTTFGGVYTTCAPGAFSSDQCLVPGVAGTTSRASAQISWRRRVIDDLGQVWTPFAYARLDSVWFSPKTDGYDNARIPNFIGASGDRFHARATPAIGLEYRFPLVASAGRFGTQMIEPIAQIVARPNEPRIGRLPNEDSQSLVFDDSNLFDWDRFAGWDRVEGGVRANYGVQYTLAGHNGLYANAMIGQSIQVAGRNSYRPGDLVNVGRDSGLESRMSDYVARLQFQASPHFGVFARGRFDRNRLNLKRLETTAYGRVGPVTANATYAIFDAQPELGYPNRREGLSTGARVELSEHWFASGSMQFDLSRYLEDRQRVGAASGSTRLAIASMGIGVGYQDECTTFTVTYTSAPKDGSFGSRKQNRTIMFQLELRTLGEVGVTQAVGTGQSGLFQ
ncbi:MAG: LPS-assembly protein LptD [Salinarimonadaceae bacterium]|nr:MAG: LPS-assembly protein LptD [Salinarimonadaceae bacterium]